ncbi:MAG: sulfatase-like hydrolase/transferase [Solirubrobacteraceae bacterium]
MDESKTGEAERHDEHGAASESGAGAPSFAASSRRTFLKRGAFSAGAVALSAKTRRNGLEDPSRRRERPNILTILVDQLRTPVWMPASAPPESAMPNLAALAAESVSFESHYTASNDCSPSRGVLLTGLYAHQTGVMVTGASWLDPRFPTWGKMLREQGYDTAYYGKWHLNPNPRAPLEQYGFSGGTYPSPNGGPGQGTKKDPQIASQFIEWLKGHSSEEPWACTVSFVNPHDMAWWYRFTERIPAEATPQARAEALPPNYETAEMLKEKGKPALQRAFQETAAQSFGEVPFTGPESTPRWLQMMDTYLLLQRYVDEQIGRVLNALRAYPKVAANTVILFTSDHGEYCGSHGLRGKGGAVYEEALRVPLYVHDARGQITSALATPRTQLTSHADITALHLTIATSGNEWRGEKQYEQIASRLDIAAICANPQAPGRDYILHSTDEDVTEFAFEPYDASSPRHVVAIRTPSAKLALYSNWPPNSIEPELTGQETEYYEYTSEEGMLELTSQVGYDPPGKQALRTTLEEAIRNELRAVLPSALAPAHEQGMSQYYAVERYEGEKVAEAHVPGGRQPAPEPL